MKRTKPVIFLTSIAIALNFCIPTYSQPQLSLDEVLEKNFQAAGGLDRIAAIKNFCFKDGRTTYYLSSAGQMKMTTGNDPVITEVILIDQQRAIRNCFDRLSDFGPLLEQTFQTRAKLYSGLFTLLKFKDELELRGTKRFGPKEFHSFSTKTKDLEVEFYIDSTDFLLKRVVFRGHNPDFGKYEINHDLGPFQEVQGINLPATWFGSQVGTRGNTVEVADVKFNLDLNEDFFRSYDINAGKTDFSGGILKGNVVDFEIGRGGQVVISTNWTDDCFERAGFVSGDKLVLTVGESQLEVDFYASQPPRSAYGQGAILLSPARGSENYVVTILASGYQDLAERLEPLMAIQIERRD